MITIRSITRMQALAERWRRAGLRVGLVPTMGALHAGHLSLVRASRARTDRTVVSVFVNPIQFGPREDLARYPRPFAHDRALLARAGVHALFAPSAAAMYPRGFATAVAVEGSLVAGLCAPRRPGPIRGVATGGAK
ncbi:MAG: pantoate--beta-alanine ligase, partial [bacterium]